MRWKWEKATHTICYCYWWWVCRSCCCWCAQKCILPGIFQCYLLSCLRVGDAIIFIWQKWKDPFVMHFSCSDAFQVILLESRDRIGGRVHTDYSFGFPVDLGASWWVPFFWTFTMCPKVHLEGMHWVFFSSFLLRRLHGVCEENPLAPIIGRLGLPLYRTSGDDSVLFDHDLER